MAGETASVASRSRIAVWFLWVLATCVPAITCLALSDTLVVWLPASFFVDDNAIFPILAWGLALLVLPGCAVGLAQSRVIRMLVNNIPGRAWFKATAFGAALSLFVASGSYDFVGDSSYFLLPGLIIGLFQASALRHSVKRSWVWVGASSLGWFLGALAVAGVVSPWPSSDGPEYPFYPLDTAVRSLLAAGIGLFVYACLTGFVLLLPFSSSSRPAS